MISIDKKTAWVISQSFLRASKRTRPQANQTLTRNPTRAPKEHGQRQTNTGKKIGLQRANRGPRRPKRKAPNTTKRTKKRNQRGHPHKTPRVEPNNSSRSLRSHYGSTVSAIYTNIYNYTLYTTTRQSATKTVYWNQKQKQTKASAPNWRERVLPPMFREDTTTQLEARSDEIQRAQYKTRPLSSKTRTARWERS